MTSKSQRPMTAIYPGIILYFCSSENQDWWLARNLSTNAEGFIPRNFVVDDNAESLESQE